MERATSHVLTSMLMLQPDEHAGQVSTLSLSQSGKSYIQRFGLEPHRISGTVSGIRQMTIRYIFRKDVNKFIDLFLKLKSIDGMLTSK